MYIPRNGVAVKRKTALLLSIALGASSLLGVTSPAESHAEERAVTLVGSLQDELGCSADWQPTCAATTLKAVPGAAGRYQGTFDVPAGNYDFKTAVNKSLDESYPKENQPLILHGKASLEFTYDDNTHELAVKPKALSGPASDSDRSLAGESLRESLTGEQFYFILTDRFANGDTSNDEGGVDGDRLAHGFDPTDKGFYHGGDLAGIKQKLDYIEGLGTTAIWLTPSFKNRPVQGVGSDASAGYHGYWTTDFTQIDPHLGTNQEMKELIDAAHARGIKVFFDIITNHTADVIDYKQGQHTYVTKEQHPYKDASGAAFDDRDYVNNAFPSLDGTSFPYTPVFRAEADKTVKVPAWLNDPTMYHNRGDSTYSGESNTYGDFVGLDDLFTERKEVLDGMIDIYSAWAAFGIDGFRIDTVKHVNLDFWQEFSPRVLQAARQRNKDFFMFGEVFDSNPEYVSQFTTKGKLQSALDFPFQGKALDFAAGKATTGVRNMFADDDQYIDTDSNAYQLAKFSGNHDMGRVASMLTSQGFTGEDLLRRVELTNDLLMLTRGNAVIYYGDEQGFAGSGGDKDARQDMFATKTAEYATESIVGAASGAKDRYDPSHPLYKQIAGLAGLRKANPALVDGAQIHRYASNEAGIYAFSRIKSGENIEYLVVSNNSTQSKSAQVPTYGGKFTTIHGGNASYTADANGRVSVTVPPLRTLVLKATAPLAARGAAPAVSMTAPSAGAVVGGHAEISASIPANTPVQTTFAYRFVGTDKWQTIGTDDNAPYRVFHDVTGIKKGTLLEYRVVAKDLSGNMAASSSYAVVGAASNSTVEDGVGPVGPVAQPDAVSVPGSHNSEMGCPEDWMPGCDEAQLSLDAKDSIWKGTFDSLTSGEYDYKAAMNKAWDENYGAGGNANGSNITYSAPGSPVTFYYDHARHFITNDAQGPIITAPGSMQSELGCPGDWDPACMAPWLIDPDGDGVYTWSSTQIPAGNYELKVAHGLAWGEDYGADGVAGGANVGFSVPRAGVQVTMSYDIHTHKITVKTADAGVAPDLKAAKAIWLAPDVIAWPRSASAADDQYRLFWAPQGGLFVDAEDISGGNSAQLSVDPNGLSDELKTKYPHLAGYQVLRLDEATAAKVPEILKGQFAVGRFGPSNAVRDATGLQIAGVIDSLYRKAANVKLGIANDGSVARLWAPTAKAVTMLLWPEHATSGSPQRVAMHLDETTGVWEAQGTDSWNRAEYLFEVQVFVPSTGKVETNTVTDPYSVGLTLNSKRSVVVDLSSSDFKPQGWATTSGPRLNSPVDQSIYELHVRDFSINDTSVPEELRGSYMAFGTDGAGSKHLAQLARAGMNTVHLLPTFDIATIEEDPSKQTVPECDLKSFAADSEEQQRCVDQQADTDGFNWGYDPYHYMTPEGSYASSTENAVGGKRTLEFRDMVKSLHDMGLRVVLDQVYNHTAQSGQNAKSVFDKVVPGYYYRLNATGAVENSTCCENVATENMMAEKLMVDSIVTWARDYRVDGFRFDLMGHHSKQNMEAIRSALDQLTVEKDGVDGKSITLYGEGWDFGEVAGNARFKQATQGQLEGTRIGTFNDRLRDGVRGGGPFDEDPRTDKGFATTGDSANDTDLVQLGLAGNLRDFQFRSQQTGQLVKGSQVDYNGTAAGYAAQPDEVVNYVDAHDNETLFDMITLKVPTNTPMDERIRLNSLALSTTALSQSISFWHAGSDMLRSKSLERDSYNAGDWFNVLDFSMTDNGFGRGLPTKSKNGDKWHIMAPLLAEPGNKPSSEQIKQASAVAQDLLKLRTATPLFRLGDAEKIQQKVSFPVSGTEHGSNQVVVMEIDDTVGADVDGKLDKLVAVFNASGEDVQQKIPGLAGAKLVLNDVQANGADPVVKNATWNAATATAHVPARTVAVFWLPQATKQQPAPTDEPTPSPSAAPTAEATEGPSDYPIKPAPPTGRTPTREPKSRPGMPRTGH